MSEPGDLCKIYKKSEGTPLLLFYVYHFPQSTLHHQVMQQANIKNDTIFSESMLLLLSPSFFKITTCQKMSCASRGCIDLSCLRLTSSIRKLYIDSESSMCEVYGFWVCGRKSFLGRCEICNDSRCSWGLAVNISITNLEMKTKIQKSIN